LFQSLLSIFSMEDDFFFIGKLLLKVLSLNIKTYELDK
jgi:hypothetical protein